MSLFQAREWWAFRPDSEDECAPGAMVVGNVDNDPAGTGKIVTGSLSGTLRIFVPAEGGYTVGHLVLEQTLDAPVLQLALGRFAPATGDYALAVLHPRSLVVYSVSSGASAGAGAGSLMLRSLYSHELADGAGASFTAAAMCYGAFGEAVGHDRICVQSMDGQLSFFDRDRHSFTRQLQASLLPGPITYVARIDAIVTVDGTLYARAYRYGALLGAVDAAPRGTAAGASAGGTGGSGSSSSSSSGAGAGTSSTGGRQLRPEWSINVGEQCDLLQTCKLTAGLTDSEVDILAVGRRTVYCLKERGVGSSQAATSSSAVMSSARRPGSVAAVSAVEPFRLQRRLERPVACACVFGGDGRTIANDGTASPSSASEGHPTDAKAAARQRLLVATHGGQLQVFAGVRLAWAAKLPGPVPVAVAVGRFGRLAGLVASLLPDGGITVTYMGTDPPQTSADGIGARGNPLDPRAAEAEHRRLLAVIKEAQGGGGAAKCRVLARLHLSPSVEPCDAPAPHGPAVASAAATALPPRRSASLTGSLFVTFVGDPGQEARRVRATLLVPPCLQLSQDSWDVGTLGAGGRAGGSTLEAASASSGSSAGGASAGPAGEPAVEGGSSREATAAGSAKPIELQFKVVGRAEGMPSTLALRAVVTYVTSSGASRVAQAAQAVPLAVVCRAVPPAKGGAFRLTLDVDGPRVPLAALFKDVLAQPTAASGAASQAGGGGGGEGGGGAGGQALTLRMHCGADVTILASAKTARLRVQAGTFEALQLVAGELTRRIRLGGPGAGAVGASSADAAAAAAGPAQMGSAVARYSDALPLVDVERLIRDHWEARASMAAALAALNDRAYQLRLVQKRLLTRFRDRTPARLGGLEKLLAATYEQLLVDADTVEAAQAEVSSAGGRLRCGVRLLLLLFRVAHRLTDADAEALDAALPAEPDDGLEQGWEERADASLTHLLRAMTGKTAGAATSGGAGEPAGLPDSPDALVRHVQILAAQLAKGVRPASSLRPIAGGGSAAGVLGAAAAAAAAAAGVRR